MLKKQVMGLLEMTPHFIVLKKLLTFKIKQLWKRLLENRVL